MIRLRASLLHVLLPMAASAVAADEPDSDDDVDLSDLDGGLDKPSE